MCKGVGAPDAGPTAGRGTSGKLEVWPGGPRRRLGAWVAAGGLGGGGAMRVRGPWRPRGGAGGPAGGRRRPREPHSMGSACTLGGGGGAVGWWVGARARGTGVR